MSNFVSFTPFGRGSAGANTDVTSPYSTLATLLNTTKLSNDNLSPRAGIPESWIVWGSGSGSGHDHSTVPLGKGALSIGQMDIDPDGENGCALAFTQTPGVLCLFGETPPITITQSQPYKEVVVSFITGSYSRSAFQTGTAPIVLLGLVWDSSSSPTDAFPCQAVVTSISSTGFTCSLARDPASPSTNVLAVGIMWVAFGVASPVVDLGSVMP